MDPTDIKSPLPPRKILFDENEGKEEAGTEVTTENKEVSAEGPKYQMPVAKKFKWGWLAVGIIVVIVLGLGIKTLGRKEIKNSTVTINYWGLWEEESVLAGVIADYEAKNKGVKINYIKNQKDNYRTRLQAKLAKTATDSDSPDIFRIHSSWVPMFADDLAKVPAEVAKEIELETDFFGVYKEDLKKNGSFVAVPIMYDGLVLYYNKEILDQAKINPPKTWWGLQEAGVKLTKKDETGRIIQAGVGMGVTENVDHWSDIVGLMLKQNGVDVLKNDTVNQKKLEDVLTYYTMFKSEYQVWDESLPPSTLFFANNKLAFYFGPSWRMFDFEAINPGLKYETTGVPQLATLENAEMDKIEREGLTDYLTNIHLATYWTEGVNRKSEKQAEAWKFIEFLASKENLERMYAAASQLRAFGEIYPRKSLAEKLSSTAKLKTFVATADNASSWYLSSRTFDDGGINDLMIGYFNDAINSIVNKSMENAKIIEMLKNGISQVATRYKLE